MTPDNFEGLKPVEAEGGQVYAESKNWSEEFLSALNILEKQNPEFSGALAGLLPNDHEAFENMLNVAGSGWYALTRLDRGQQDQILEIIRSGLNKDSLRQIADIVNS